MNNSITVFPSVKKSGQLRPSKKLAIQTSKRFSSPRHGKAPRMSSPREVVSESSPSSIFPRNDSEHG